MTLYEIIKKKRDGGKLTPEEIRLIVDASVGKVDGARDYHLAAFCMAVFFAGMDDEEMTELSLAMAQSGDTVDLSEFGNLSCDKHSTGGVGDKISLILGPVVASCGVKMAKMSGRGLGHTGGTVDKLESIPGFKIELSAEEFFRQTREIGIALIGQSADIAPSDKKLYALRDCCACVESMPLIASSIMSKKLAAGAKNIILDVKCGDGAFMKNLDDARELAKKMVSVGRLAGRNIAAVITDMNTPLGHNIGNALEVSEVVKVLKNEGPEDLKLEALELSSRLVSMGLDIPQNEAFSMCKNKLENGEALAKFTQWIARQGGDVSFIEKPENLPLSSKRIEVISEKSGYISKMHAEEIGLISCLLGAGREAVEDKIDYGAGIIMSKKTGGYVSEGDVLAVLFTEKDVAEEAVLRYKNAIEFSDEAPVICGEILDIIE